eukprot:CAMPEP_0172865698 /NCGR_PEP_ID=MMETSP1075-20121228/81564_1 /TAXON_ID=2916 /ORGANISM="Ceratium fusus, Strain PA161109" /LENGTH=133 /DNA_ID=CAMNT_0013714775 /DNA_START=78 /DNA_END=479 /DNA_ORIENTATION=+
MPETSAERRDEQVAIGEKPGVSSSESTESELRQLEAAISTGNVQEARAVARRLAQRCVKIEATVDRSEALASLRKQLQTRLIGMGYTPARVIQALRKGNAQSVDEAIAWLSSQPEVQSSRVVTPQPAAATAGT